MATTEKQPVGSAVARILESGDAAAIGALGWGFVAGQCRREGDVEGAAFAYHIGCSCAEASSSTALFHDLATATGEA